MTYLGTTSGVIAGMAIVVVLAWLTLRLRVATAADVGRPWLRATVLLLETILFSVVVPGGVAYWLPKYAFKLDFHVLRDGVEAWSAWQVISLLPFGLGLIVYLRCLWEFAERGRGIPAPIDHPKALVVTGLYRYVRNPMYVGVLLILLGEVLFFRHLILLWYALGWLILVHAIVVYYEEPHLSRVFGSSYEHYRAEVRRWLPGRAYQAHRHRA